MNGLRIAATGLACERWSSRAASGPWHTFSGWVTFLVAVFVLAQLPRALSRSKGHGPVWPQEAVGA